MRASMLLVLCAVAGAHADFTAASVDDVQQYLKDWDLHEFLGDGVGWHLLWGSPVSPLTLN